MIRAGAATPTESTTRRSMWPSLDHTDSGRHQASAWAPAGWPPSSDRGASSFRIPEESNPSRSRPLGYPADQPIPKTRKAAWLTLVRYEAVVGAGRRAHWAIDRCRKVARASRPCLEFPRWPLSTKLAIIDNRKMPTFRGRSFALPNNRRPARIQGNTVAHPRRRCSKVGRSSQRSEQEQSLAASGGVGRARRIHVLYPWQGPRFCAKAP